MPHRSRPGDVLADRYRLVDLLTESGDGRFWRAYDRVLERHVALHVIRADDPRAQGLMAAARRSATVLDPHILRVLDADITENVCFIVNEWGWGTSLDIVVAGSGPLGPRRSAWLVSEVASAIAVAHAAGVSHGRLVPENVLIDRAGGVRIIGLGVDAALHGLSSSRRDVDVADLAGLLYCALTTTWAGPSTSLVPSAPREHDEVLRPRRVRAGVPRALDVLCDEVLHRNAGARSRDHVDLQSARAIADYLADFVGDPLGMPEALVASTPDVLPDAELVVLPPVPEMSIKDDPAPQPRDISDDTSADLTATDLTTTGPGPRTGPAASVEAAEERPTEAGLPIFGDDDDDVSWLEKSTEPAPPPPPFEEPPERPLFAPTPPDGEPVRRARVGAAGAGADGYWPWESGPGAAPDATRTSGRPVGQRLGQRLGQTVGRNPDTGVAGTTSGTVPATPDEVPGRSFLRLAAGIAVAVLLLIAVVVAVNLGRGRTLLGHSTGGSSTDPSTSSRPRTTSSTAADALVTGVTASAFDPQGGDGTENDAAAPLAVDGRPATAWTTVRYFQQLGPAGVKDGVGLMLDLGRTRTVSSVDLTLVGAPTGVSLYLTPTRPTSVAGLRAVADGTATGTSLTLHPAGSSTGRYLVVWLTELPAVDRTYQGGIAEVGVHGA